VDNKDRSSKLPQPIFAGLFFGVLGALLVGAQFKVITIYPWPVAIAPYFEDNLFGTGAMWGFVVCGFVGWLIGWLSDERHFSDTKYE
jgi:cell division protein FtsX